MVFPQFSYLLNCDSLFFLSFGLFHSAICICYFTSFVRTEHTGVKDRFNHSVCIHILLDITYSWHYSNCLQMNWLVHIEKKNC